jgi:adenylate kinase
MKYRTILLFGAPGSGKGTQGKILSNIPGFFHCACGDVFRSLKADSELGGLFVSYSSKGQLVPDDLTIRLWRESIEASTQGGRFHPKKDLLVLDGIPRNVAQAKMLENVLDVRAMFWLKITNEDALVRRMQRRALKENRLDDLHLDVIRERLHTYDKDTRPVADFYGKKLVHRIDSMQTPLGVCKDLLAKLVKLDIQPRT